MRRILFLLGVLVCFLGVLGVKPSAAPAAGRFTIDDLVAIRHPSGAQWTPDGQTVWWVYDQGGIDNAWAAAADGATPAHALTDYADGQNSAFRLSPDGTRIAFLRDGDLMLVALGGGAARLAAHQATAINSVNWSADSATLEFTAAPAAGETAAANPGRGPAPFARPEIGNKILWVTNPAGGRGGAAFTVAAAGGAPVAAAAGAAGGGRGNGGFGGRGRGGAQLDGGRTLQMQAASDGKSRTWSAVDTATGDSKVLFTATEDKFFSSVNTTNSAVSPDRKWVLFTADMSGWDQLYVVPAAGGAPLQLTTVPGDHWRAVWSHDSRRVAWDTNTADHPGDREVQFAEIAEGATPRIVDVTQGPGTNTAPQWSPDDTRLLYQHTDAQTSAELYVAPAAANPRATRLTHSLPATLESTRFVAPQLVHYPGPDGKPVPAWLFVPPGLDRAKRHAAIVWIHPDGVNQNYDGWHPDRNEAVYYEFHQYLLQEGYVVIAPDYRGSIGYGRDWRNGVYMDVGGNDAKDARLAATYLKTLGYVDAARIGVWGLSYGGFFVLQAVTQEPTLFNCAVDVAGVTDYALYYEDPYHGGWTTSRIGTPEQHPEVYAQAEPMRHVDQLQRPLLVLAGTSDVNVPFLESALLIDALLKAGKGDLTTFMMYPGEFHYFDRSFVVRDAWRRVDAFFATHLQPEK